MKRVLLVGGGNIANAHAEAIQRGKEARLAGVVEPNAAVRQRFASRWKINSAYASAEEALAARDFDAVHVLVPPSLHAAVARPYLEAGLPVFLEKPMGVSRAECEELVRIGSDKDAAVFSNHNFTFHPAFEKLRRLIAQGDLGPLRHVDCIYSVPLRQLDAGQLSHWMFQAPINILLEQAVHPLSQMIDLAGGLTVWGARASNAVAMPGDGSFCRTIDAGLTGSKTTASLHFSVGEAFASWQIQCVCDDGVAVADILRSRVYVQDRARWLEPAENWVTGLRLGASTAFQSSWNLVRYAASMVGIGGRSDTFFQSMQGSIRAFYDALAAPAQADRRLKLGPDVVALCEDIAGAAKLPAPRPAAMRSFAPADSRYDILVIGGTGFIGRQVVRQLLARGKRLGVMARGLANLPDLYSDPNVVLVKGDLTSRADLEQAIQPNSIVVNLAQGGGGDSWADFQAGVVDSAASLLEVCRDRNVSKLVHVSSIAALYLGDEKAMINGQTAPDPQSAERALYSRAKAEAERRLLSMDAGGVKRVILRPGIVVGLGTSPFHTGVGYFNNEQHCLGWNAGRNPLPFVLVEDTASAIVAACFEAVADRKCYNLVGDVRLSARDYFEELARASRRPLQFHAQSPEKLYAIELVKWGIKRLGGRQPDQPSLRDFRSRAMPARFNIDDVKSDLHWKPVNDRATFIDKAIRVHYP